MVPRSANWLLPVASRSTGCLPHQTPVKGLSTSWGDVWLSGNPLGSPPQRYFAPETEPAALTVNEMALSMSVIRPQVPHSRKGRYPVPPSSWLKTTT